jgi:hypothetical protein
MMVSFDIMPLTLGENPRCVAFNSVVGARNLGRAAICAHYAHTQLPRNTIHRNYGGASGHHRFRSPVVVEAWWSAMMTRRHRNL